MIEPTAPRAAGEMLLGQALWLRGPRMAELRSEIVPPPGPGELRLRAIASAISQGTELLVYRGQVPATLPLDLPTLSGSFGFPIKYGYASVAVVTDVGPAVGDFVPGDTVFALHPHQSVYLAPATLAWKLPPAIDPLRGLFVANLETALTIVHDTPLKLGDTALVFGQGVVGLLVAQLLRLAGAGRVIAVEPLALRQRLARAVGVDAVLRPDTNLAEQVQALNGGRAADLAIEVSGATPALQTAIDLVADEGSIIVASWYGTKPITLDLGGRFHRGRLHLRSSQVGRLNPELAGRWDRKRRSETVLSLLSRLRLHELISHQIPFDDAPAAYRLIDERPDETGQVVLVYEEKG